MLAPSVKTRAPVVKDRVRNPVMAEMEAVRVALLVAHQNRWREIEIQVDIKAIAMCLQDGKSLVLESTSHN